MHIMQSREADVIVVGAGMSGLVAAKKLQERLVGTSASSVMVLEARDRLGGRIHTVDLEKAGTIDMGAAWIHGHSKKNPISQLYKQVKKNQQTSSSSSSSLSTTNKKKIGLFNTNWDNMKVYNIEGPTPQVIPNHQLFRAYKQRDKLIEKVQDVLEEESADVPLETAIQKVQPEALQDPLMKLTLEMKESDFGGSLNDLSTWWFDGDEEFPGQDALLTTGYQTLVDHVATGLDVRTNVQVESIQYTSNCSSEVENDDDDDDNNNSSINNPNNTTGVQIETTHQGTFKAKCCIVTVPLGVLKANTIQFRPPLPVPKQAAIQSVGFGTIAKVVLVFDTVFWPLKTHAFANVAKSRTTNHQDRGKFPSLINMYPATGKPVLVAFASGEYVKTEMEKLDDETLVQQVMEIVQNMFGKKSPEPIESYVTRWGTDPYSRGTYSYHAAGQKNHAWHDLERSVGGVLYFAGEHCSKKYRGTVHGAYLSGERAADEVYKQIKKQISSS